MTTKPYIGMTQKQAYELGLWSAPEGFALVPVEATESMLRPFTECPEDELALAWRTALILATPLPKEPT